MDKEGFNKEITKALTGLSKGSSESTEVIGLVFKDIFYKMIRMVFASFKKTTP